MKTIAFFNVKAGVGTTSLVYHLAWMYADLGLSVVAADLDPQANLSRMFLDEDRLEALWPDGPHPETVHGALQPLLDGVGDVLSPHVERVTEKLGLLVGDLALSTAEDELSSQWPACLDRRPRAFQVTTALWRVVEQAAHQQQAAVILIDVGPNLGSTTRAALIAAEHVVIPLVSDLYSLQGLRNLGPPVHRWRGEWAERRGRNPLPGLSLPKGTMSPSGYIVIQHVVRLDRPITVSMQRRERIPGVYRTAVLDEPTASLNVKDDPHCLAILKHHWSLMPLVQEARKPMFFLKPADGAIGGHAMAASQSYRDFRALARRIADRCGLVFP